MTSYFFDTNILFKIFFNRLPFDRCEFKDYLTPASGRFISKNVEYEFSNIFLEFSSELNHFLIEAYYLLDEAEQNITPVGFQRLTKNTEVLKFNNRNISSMIWQYVCGDKKRILGDDFKKGLHDFIISSNSYFQFKYMKVMDMMTVNARLDNYDKIEETLKPHIHMADLKICLDAHDIAVKNGIDDLVFVSGDKIFSKNSDLICDCTKISDIIQI